MAYKPNIDDERESPALEIMDIVSHRGGIVSYSDPHIPTVKTNHGKNYSSEELNTKIVVSADCVVLTTNHDAFDIEFIKENSKLIVDMRNMVKVPNKNVYGI